MKQNDNSFLEKTVQQYGDLIYDICLSMMSTAPLAQIAFKSILKTIKKNRPYNKFEIYERVWILKVTHDKILNFARKHRKKLSPSEQIMLDATLDQDERIKCFDSYFHRLRIEDQLLLLLRDKYGLSYSEIAGIVGTAQNSIIIQRQQALRNLEDIIWSAT